MALTFPLALADFADVIGIQTVKWQLNDNRELSGMGTGQILQADLAPALWSAEVTLRPWRTNDAREIEAKINAVVRSIGSFYLYDPRKAVPKSGAAALSGKTVSINAKADAKSLSLKGLPSAYALTAGDYLSFDYGTSTRRWFGEIAESVTADSSGDTASFEVSPYLPTDAAADIEVTLVKPAMKAIIVPGSLQVQYAAGFTTISFNVMQKR
jgi:hypothetical protein